MIQSGQKVLVLNDYRIHFMPKSSLVMCPVIIQIRFQIFILRCTEDMLRPFKMEVQWTLFLTLNVPVLFFERRGMGGGRTLI